MPPLGGPTSDPPGDWTYHPPGDPDFADVDAVRLYLRDTNPAIRLLGDAELQHYVDVWMPKYDSLIYVAAIGAEALATAFAGVLSINADGVNVNTADLSERYATVAARLRALHKDAQIGEVDITNLIWGHYEDPSLEPLNFGVGMMDNLEAGSQAYGSHRARGSYEDYVGWW